MSDGPVILLIVSLVGAAYTAGFVMGCRFNARRSSGKGE